MVRKRSWRETLVIVALGGLLSLSAGILTSCEAHTSNSLGDAYVAPAQLNLRSELSSKFNNVATLKHGEHVIIVDVKRRFVKIRSQGGVEGWVDSEQLMGPEAMSALEVKTQNALKLPSQGSASVYEPLNIHIDPNRQSPALSRINEGELVAVLRHELTPKDAPPPKQPSLIKERPQPQRRKKGRQSHTQRLPAPPPPPKVPENWQLSLGGAGPFGSVAEQKAKKDAELTARKAELIKKPVVLEDWSLVRTKRGESGWVLSRNLVMAIPDEVAQYAEGHRITSYFDLGEVQDEEKGPHHNWLWTTSTSQKPYDYDSWRVFLWNRRRHRYETSYRQRDLEGFYPTSVDPRDAAVFGRTFHLLTKDDDQKMRMRTYIFDGVRVHLVQTEEYRPEAAKTAAEQTAARTADKQQGWFARAMAWWKSKFSRTTH